MSGLLDFALGFGQGAASGVAQTAQMNIANKAEQTRMANLERLRAQYRKEEMAYGSQLRREEAAFASTMAPQEIDTISFQMPGEENPVTVDRRNVERINSLIEAGAFEVRPRSGPLVTVDSGEKLTPYQEQISKNEAERAATIDTQADVARANLPIVERMETALESGKFETGFLAGTRLTVGEATRLFGINPETLPEGLKIGDPATGNLLRSGFANLAINEAQGMGGRTTNMGLQMISDSLGNLETTPEGNRIILDTMRRLYERQIEIASLKDKYNKYGGLSSVPEGVPTFNQALNELEESDPIVNEEMIERIQSLTSPGDSARGRFPSFGGGPERPSNERVSAVLGIESQSDFQESVGQLDRSLLQQWVTENAEQLGNYPSWKLAMIRARLAGSQ